MSRLDTDPEHLARVVRGEEKPDTKPTTVRELTALIWSILLRAMGRAPEEDRPDFARTAFKRKGQAVHILDVKTREMFVVRATNTPEARMFTRALTLGAIHAPTMSAENVARAAKRVVELQLGQGRT
jgi:hypothetical protein